MSFWYGVVSVLGLEALAGWWLVRTFKKQGASSVSELISNSFKILRPKNKDQDTFRVADNGKYASIEFTHNGEKYRLFVPHDDSNVFTMTNTKIYIDTDVGRTELSGHHPCVPVLITPHHLDASRIVVENEMEDLVTEFTGTQRVEIRDS